jgi:Fe-S-cluster containining protein
MMAPTDAHLKTACDHCSFCCNRPGWFAPGEAQETARALGIPWDRFRDSYLVIDSFLDGDTVIYAWCPAKVLLSTGEPVEPPGRPVGPTWQIPHLGQMCIFWRDFRCSIHEVKPRECREYECWNPDPRRSTALHGLMVRLWRRHQGEFGRRVAIRYREGGRERRLFVRELPLALARAGPPIASPWGPPTPGPREGGVEGGVRPALLPADAPEGKGGPGPWRNTDKGAPASEDHPGGPAAGDP